MTAHGAKRTTGSENEIVRYGHVTTIPTLNLNVRY